MRRFNFSRSILIIVVAFAANSITKLLCSLLGASPQMKENLPILVMVLAAIFTYSRLTKNQKRRD